MRQRRIQRKKLTKNLQKKPRQKQKLQSSSLQDRMGKRISSTVSTRFSTNIIRRQTKPLLSSRQQKQTLLHLRLQRRKRLLARQSRMSLSLKTSNMLATKKQRAGCSTRLSPSTSRKATRLTLTASSLSTTSFMLRGISRTSM